VGGNEQCCLAPGNLLCRWCGRRRRS
jgi:hypothetical protein